MLIALLAAMAAPAIAAPPTPPAISKAAVDPLAVAEALRLLDQEGFEEDAIRTANLSIELMLGSMVEQIQKASGETIPQDFVAKLKQTMTDHLNSTLVANMSSIKQQAATIYAQEFTREELARLREISRDPLMVKSRERNKVIGPKLMALGAYTMRKSEPELEAKIQRLVTDYLANQKKSADHS